MKLEKAIEILTEWKEPETVDEADELHQARELGFEAMIRLQGNRKHPKYASNRLLPGETEE